MPRYLIRRLLRQFFGKYGRKYIRRIKGPYLIFAILTLIGAGLVADWYIPPQHLLWRSLNVQAPIGLATKIQLRRLSFSAPETCQASLALSGPLAFKAAAPKDGPDICGWRYAYEMAAGETMGLSPVTLRCPLAVGVNIWLSDIDQLAQEMFGQNIAQVHHAGSYNCRRQRGNSSSAWSEHAFANAWDVTGFTLTDGTVISVLKDWDITYDKSRHDKAQFLHRARDRACRLFQVTLSPDYNAAHKDHFHFDMGPYSSCR